MIRNADGEVITNGGEDGEEISQWVGLEVRVCLPSLRTLSYQYGKKRASEEETRPRKRRN